MHKCIICGEDTGNETIIGDTTIHLCNRRKCIGIFNFKVSGSFPIVWLCPDDVLEDEKVSEEIARYYEEHPERFVGIAHANGDSMWDDMFSEMFHDTVSNAGENMEEDYIKNLPFNQLALAINAIISEKAKQVYKDRLSEGK